MTPRSPKHYLINFISFLSKRSYRREPNLLIRPLSEFTPHIKIVTYHSTTYSREKVLNVKVRILILHLARQISFTPCTKSFTEILWLQTQTFKKKGQVVLTLFSSLPPKTICLKTKFTSCKTVQPVQDMKLHKKKKKKTYKKAEILRLTGLARGFN